MVVVAVVVVLGTERETEQEKVVVVVVVLGRAGRSFTHEMRNSASNILRPTKRTTHLTAKVKPDQSTTQPTH